MYDQYGWDGVLRNNVINDDDNGNWNDHIFHDAEELFQMFSVTRNRKKHHEHPFFSLFDGFEDMDSGDDDKQNNIFSRFMDDDRDFNRLEMTMVQ